MPRPIRRDTIEQGGTYHIYARGNDRMTLFRSNEDYLFYLNALNALATPHGVVLFHYALMPNHVHLLLRPDGAHGLSQFMKTLQIRFAKHFCRKYRFVGHVWQGRFKHRAIGTDSYLFACGNYIEMNPVRARLVTDPIEWPYSSYRAYAYGYPDTLVEQDPMYSHLGHTPAERQANYRMLVAQTRATSDPAVSGTAGSLHGGR